MPQPQQTPFELIGGAKTVRAIVDRFYDLMEADPTFAELRAMHAQDLTPMRDSLAGFLAAWSGGPRDWFTQRPGACVMSLHGKLNVTRETANQWVKAMTRAIEETPFPAPELAPVMIEHLERMAMGMARETA